MWIGLTKSGKTIRGAASYWKELAADHPSSPWRARLQQPMRYLEFVGGGRDLPPRFEGAFQSSAGALQIGPDALRGKVCLVLFWDSSAVGVTEQVRELDGAVERNLREYPDLVGKVQVLGVNLDATRELYEAAVKERGIDWPEHFDGRGFDSPLVHTLALPRLPQWMVVSAEGKIVYLGSDYGQFGAHGGREMRRVRGLEE